MVTWKQKAVYEAGEMARWRKTGGGSGGRVALGVPMWLDAHLAAMCDRSSRANDGLPEASSIRPGLAGLPASGTKRDAYRHVAEPFVCL